MENQAQWEQYIQVWRTATTRNIDVAKLHIQLSRRAHTEHPAIEAAIRIGLEKRGWVNKEALAPTSVSYKKAIAQAPRRRGWG